MTEKIKIAITHGDINGVGYELILKTFEENTMFELCTPILYGSIQVLNYYKKVFDSNLEVKVIAKPEEAEENILNVIDCCGKDMQITMGEISEIAGKAGLQALIQALQDCKLNRVKAIVTAPVNKACVNLVYKEFKGNTEFLATALKENGKELMILMNEKMRIALATTHLPLNEVGKSITMEELIQKLKIYHQTLKQDFCISNPRIAVLALNPHAGDGGIIGKEEETIIIPALEKLKEEGILCFGPYPSDSFFGTGHYTHFDGILAMYHDQGLIPFKAMAMREGVNFTAGLSVIRTSPDHGTAYDLVGKGEVDENSFRQAIYQAIDIYRHRTNYFEAHLNPLPDYEFEVHKDESFKHDKELHKEE